MADVNASIHIGINSSAAMGELAAMQAKMAALNKSMATGAAASTKAQLAQAAAMGQMLNRSGQWTAAMQTMQTATGRMAAQFDKGTVSSFQQYRKNSKAFSRDHSAINQLAAQRVRALQTQYAALGREVDGTQKVMKMQPTGMMREWGADAMFAQQKAVLFRRNLEMGANSMVNWGKNTQWAGRQMMVGMGIPMALAAAGAVSAFKDIETASISFKRVYGDATTSSAEKAQMLGKIQSGVAQDMTKYGIAVSDTLDVAAKAAATGQQGDDLVSATRETMRLATLGQLDYDQALQSTIATQTAFGVSAKGMTRVTDFLNAAENQTILSMDDMTKAIPRVAPVIRGLGGDVEDLGVLMTALRAGGVTAEQGANALKSGLASLINPTSSATEAMESLGIPLDKIVQANKGDLIGTVQDFGKALKELPKFEQQQALESLFGKYQYARMGALFRNINSKQAKETARLSEANSSELAKMSENELGQIADSALTQFQGAIERLKAAAAPLGEQVLRTVTPMIDGVSKLLGFFANNDAARNVALFGLAFAGLAGVATMITGVFANFFGTMTKGALLARRGLDRMMGRSLPRYSSIADLEAAAAAKQLGASAEGAAAGLYAEASAAKVLAEALTLLDAKQSAVIANNGMMGPGGAGGVVAKPGGPTPVPGGGKPGAVAVEPSAVPTGSQVYTRTAKDLSFERAHLSEPSATEVEKARAYYANAANAATAKGGAAKFAEQAALVLAKDKNGEYANKIYNSDVLNHDPDVNTKMETKAGVSKAVILEDVQKKGAFLWASQAEMLGNAGAFGSGKAWRDDPKIQAAARGAAVQYYHALDALSGSTLATPDIQKAAHDAFQAHFVDSGLVSQEAVDKMKTATYVDKPGWTDENGSHSGTRIRLSGWSGEQGAEKASYRTSGGTNAELVEKSPFAKMDPLQPDELTAAQTRGAVVLGQHNDAVEESTKATQDATKQTNKNLRVARTAEGDMGMGKSSFLAPKPTPAIRQGGAFTPDANKWSNRLFGLGMAADMTTMGLMAMGKDVPAWGHLVGMGAMTFGMMPDLLLKPMAKVGTGLKALGPKLVSGSGAMGKLATGAKIGAELLGVGNKQGLMSFVGKLGIAGMAISAVAGTAYIVNDGLERAVGTVRDSIAAQATSTSAVSAYAQEVGEESRTMQQQRTVVSEAIGETVTQAEQAAVSQKMAGQSGQLMIQQVQTALQGGQLAGVNSVIAQAAGLYGEGLTSRKETLQIGAELASMTGLEGQTVDIIGNLKDIMGKGIDSPLEIQAEIANLAMAPGTLAQTGLEGAANAPWYAQAWGDLAANGMPGFLALLTGGKLGGFDSINGEEAIAARGAGEGAFKYMQAGGALSSGDAINNIMKAFQANGDMQNKAIEAFSSSIDAALKPLQYGEFAGLFSKLQDAKGAIDTLPEDQQGAGERGMMELGASVASGKMSKTFADLLMNGDAQANIKVATQFDGMSSTDMAMINAVGNETNADGSIGTNAANLASSIAAPDANMDLIKANVAAYNELPSGGRKSLTVQFGVDGTDQINAAKQSVKEIEAMPPEVQKKISISVDEAGQKDIQGALDTINNFNEKGFNRATQGAGVGPDVSGAKEILSVAKELSNPKYQKFKIDAKIGKVDRSAVNAATKGSKATIKTKYDKPSNQSALKPKGTQKIKTKYDQPQNKSAIKPKGAEKVKTKYEKPANQGALKPKAQRVKVTYVPGKLPKVPPANQKVNRTIGEDQTKQEPPKMPQIITREMLPGNTLDMPPELPQFINRTALPGNTLIPPPDVYQNVIRRTVGGSAVGGPIRGYANGGNIDYFPRRKGRISGPGGKTGDKIPAMLSNGEFVIKASSVEKYGAGFMDRLNSGTLSSSKVAYLKDGPKGEGDGDKPKKEKSDSKDKWSWKKDVSKPAMKEDRIYNKAVSILGKFNNRRMAVLNKLIEADNPKAFEKYKNLDGKAKKKFIRAIIRKERNAAAVEIKSSFAETNKTDLLELKSWKKKVSIARSNNAFAKEALQLTNEEALMLDKMKKKQAKKYLKRKARLAEVNQLSEFASMSEREQQKTKSSQYQDLAQAMRDAAEAGGEKNIRAKYGKGSAWIQAINDREQLKADRLSHANDLEQRKIDDINEAYDEQAKILDKVQASQQSLANMEKARLGVAGALASGDVAAAAAAMQEAKQTQAQFAQEQMRASLDAEREARIKAHQAVIDDNQTKIDAISDSIWEVNQTISETQADAALWGAALADGYEAQNNHLLTQQSYWDAIIADIVQAQTLLGQAINLPNPVKKANVNDGNKDKDKDKNKDKQGKGKGGVKGKNNKKPQKKAKGGWVTGYGSGDKVPALLTPGEFVVNKLSAQKFGGALESLNSPSFRFAAAPGMASANGAVGYNGGNTYALTFNMSNTSADVNQLADAVVRRIESVDSRGIRSRGW